MPDLEGEPRPDSQPVKRKTILVIGDWVVDEQWVTSIHRSKTRSRTGLNHHRLIQTPKDCAFTLAGAGKTTSILHQAFHTASDDDERQPAFTVSGAGSWDERDQGVLEALLDPTYAEGQTSHRLTFPDVNPDNSSLHNLGLSTNFKPVGGSESDAPSTTRVVRVWQQTGAEPRLLHRIDAEIPPKGELKVAELESDETLMALLANVDAIVLKDMGKGMISSKWGIHLTQVTPRCSMWLRGGLPARFA